MKKNILVEKYKEKHKLSDSDIERLCASDVKPHDPSLMLESDFFVNVLNNVKDKEITIYPDYDADGVCGGITAYVGLNILGFKVNLYKPDAHLGYGLNPASAEDMLSYFPNTEVVLTVDNGIAAKEGVDFCKDKNLIVLISDHHVGQTHLFPNKADAVVNPNRVDKEEKYPFKSISGTAVIWKILLNYSKKHQADKLDFIEDLIFFVGVSSITDVMPLVDENRYFVKQAINLMKNQTQLSFMSTEDECHESYALAFKGLNTLLEYFADLSGKSYKSFDDSTIGFQIGPILNTPRRMLGKSDLSFKLFLEPNKEVVKNLVKLNNERKSEVNNVKIDVEDNYAIVEYLPELKHGIAGLVASKILNKYKKPTIILGKNFTGSGRSLDNLHLFNALQAIEKEDLFKKWGGHGMAVGLTLKENKLDDFKTHLNNYFSKIKHIPSDSGIIVLSILDFDLETVKEAQTIFKKLAPYSEINPAPIFEIELDTKYLDISFIGKEKTHLRLVHPKFTILKWNAADDYVVSEKVKIIGKFNINYFNGGEYLQFMADEIHYI